MKTKSSFLFLALLLSHSLLNQSLSAEEIDSSSGSTLSPQHHLLGADLMANPLMNVTERTSRAVRTTFILHEDGTIIWRKDFDELREEGEAIKPSSLPLNPDYAYMLELVKSQQFSELADYHYDHHLFGPFFMGRVSKETIGGFLDSMTMHGFCEETGSDFFVPGGASLTFASVGWQDCSFNISSPLSYVSDDTLMLPNTTIDLEGIDRDEVLAEQPEPVQQAYRLMGFLRKSMGDMVAEAENNGSVQYIDYVPLKRF